MKIIIVTISYCCDDEIMSVILSITHSVRTAYIYFVGVFVAVEAVMMGEGGGEFSSTRGLWHRNLRRRWEGGTLARTPLWS